MRKIFPAALLCALLLNLSAPVLAYSDLPEDNWAYPVMAQAADLGILTGYGDGTMHPGDPLSWGQCLIMLGRTFYPDRLAEYPASEDEHWASGAYRAAMALDVLEQADFLPVSPSTLNEPVSRQDMAELVNRALLRVHGAQPVTPDLSVTAFPDFAALPESYRAAVLQCCAQGIIKGRDDGRFAGSDTLTRAEGAALMVRALPSGEQPPVDQSGAAAPPADIPAPPADNAVPSGPLRKLGSNSAKLNRLYGTDAMTRYPSMAEADAHMTTVSVPVWRLDKNTGVKSPSTLSFSVNAAIADDMTAIFTEIYNDPEQFPIYSIGGYQWRQGATGEHNCGTAIDINYIENYQIYPDGSVGAGKCWLPGENPWSIPEDGSVVRVFNAYGYSWGGNAWPSYSNKDYMHFSYLGL